MRVEIKIKFQFPIKPLEIEPTIFYDPNNELDRAGLESFEVAFWPLILQDLQKMNDNIFELCHLINKEIEKKIKRESR